MSRFERIQNSNKAGNSNTLTSNDPIYGYVYDVILDDTHPLLKDENKYGVSIIGAVLYKSIGMSIMSSIPTFIFTLNAIYHRKIIEWYWIIIENLLMFFLLGIFEYLFFINIVLKYDPITNDELKYLLNIQFIRYLNETLNI